MGLVGNDIIDWAIAKTQHQKMRQRCLEKLFTPSEIELIRTSEYPLQLFWVFWSIKEAAYKAWQRHHCCKPIFNPFKIEIKAFKKNNFQLASKVKIEEFSVEIKTEVNSDFIYSFCHSPFISNDIYSIKEEHHLKEKLLEQGWELKKQAYNIPYIVDVETKINRPISLSHDGRFYAVSFVKKDYLYYAKAAKAAS